MRHVPRVAAIHDMSGFGRCSLTVILPVLSAMGVQCCPIPTAYLSTHTGGFSGMARADLTATRGESVAHWAELGLDFDGVYTGYLSSPEQAGLAMEAIRRLKRTGGLAVVDPACGDNGRLYASCTPALWAGLEALCAHGDVITPNLTEAALLLGVEYGELPMGGEAAMELAWRLSAEGSRSVVLTGGSDGPDQTGAACFDRERGEARLVSAPRHPGSWPGTGDLFTAVLTGALLQGRTLFDGAQAAADFVSACVAHTLALGTPVREGVAFEPMLGRLASKLPYGER